MDDRVVCVLVFVVRDFIYWVCFKGNGEVNGSIANISKDA